MDKYFLTLVLTFLLTSCDVFTGNEIVRLKIDQISNEDVLTTSSGSAELEKGDKVVIWSEMDLEYEGEVQLRFILDIYKDQKKYDQIEIDPFDSDIKTNELKSSYNYNTKWSFRAKNTSLQIKEDGNYTFKTILVGAENPTLKVNKADLVLKK